MEVHPEAPKPRSLQLKWSQATKATPMAGPAASLAGKLKWLPSLPHQSEFCLPRALSHQLQDQSQHKASQASPAMPLPSRSPKMCRPPRPKPTATCLQNCIAYRSTTCTKTQTTPGCINPLPDPRFVCISLHAHDPDTTASCLGLHAHVHICCERVHRGCGCGYVCV